MYEKYVKKYIHEENLVLRIDLFISIINNINNLDYEINHLEECCSIHHNQKNHIMSLHFDYTGLRKDSFPL